MSNHAWDRFCQQLCIVEPLDILLDSSRAGLPEDLIDSLGPALARAFDEMEALEAGAIANADEQRRVGHYWLRAPERAPTVEIAQAIRDTVTSVRKFADEVHSGQVQGERGPFRQLLLIGIGGSALGPQLVADALGGPLDRLRIDFLDNTDPAGFDRTLEGLRLEETLTLVLSKSGGTKETRNGMLECRAAYERAGLSFARHAVAVTGEGSELDCLAVADGWLRRFPMWDWVGGRTSVLSAVGLLPAALQGLDIEALLEGARAMDEATRQRHAERNPAARLALAWHHLTDGRGRRDMVILPYRDRLSLTARYLQQLVMESLGKEHDRSGRIVEQGLSVYGNKGSTDQHAYVQQLRDGVPNFFATFIEALEDRAAPSLQVEPGVTSSDYLFGFFMGTREALREKGRPSLTLTVPRVDARSLGALLALFERAVGLYASLVDVNAYHQPGVEAGKRAAGALLALQARLLEVLSPLPASAEELAERIGADDRVDTVWKLLEHLASVPDHGVRRTRDPGAPPTAARYARP